jgi:hypothetical protein
MKTILMWNLLCVLLSLFLCSCNKITENDDEDGTTITYDFINGIGNDFMFDNPTGLFLLNDSEGNMRITKQSDTIEGVLKSGMVYSKFSIKGDFKISVDYNLNSPLNNGDQLQFHLYSQNFIYFLVRSNEEFLGGNNYHVFFRYDNIVPNPGISTNDISGTFRFVRKGSTIDAYFKSKEKTEYSLVDSHKFDTCEVSVGMVLQNQPFSHSTLDASFDNLRILKPL